MRWTFRQKALDNTTTLKRIQTESFIFFETCRVSNHLKVHSLTRSYIFFFFLHIYISSTLTTNKKTKNLVSSKRRFFLHVSLFFQFFFNKFARFLKKNFYRRPTVRLVVGKFLDLVHFGGRGLRDARRWAAALSRNALQWQDHGDCSIHTVPA